MKKSALTVPRRSKKMSASSNKITASQRAAMDKMRLKFVSRTTGSVPSSPTVMEYRGALSSSAMASALLVFPTPGGPCSKTIAPFPLPAMMSTEVPAFLRIWLCTQARSTFFVPSDKTERKKTVEKKNSEKNWSRERYPVD